MQFPSLKIFTRLKVLRYLKMFEAYHLYASFATKEGWKPQQLATSSATMCYLLWCVVLRQMSSGSGSVEARVTAYPRSKAATAWDAAASQHGRCVLTIKIYQDYQVRSTFWNSELEELSGNSSSNVATLTISDLPHWNLGDLFTLLLLLLLLIFLCLASPSPSTRPHRAAPSLRTPKSSPCERLLNLAYLLQHVKQYVTSVIFKGTCREVFDTKCAVTWRVCNMFEVQSVKSTGAKGQRAQGLAAARNACESFSQSEAFLRNHAEPSYRKLRSAPITTLWPLLHL